MILKSNQKKKEKMISSKEIHNKYNAFAKALKRINPIYAGAIGVFLAITAFRLYSVYDTQNYHHEYFEETYCSVIEDDVTNDSLENIMENSVRSASVLPSVIKEVEPIIIEKDETENIKKSTISLTSSATNSYINKKANEQEVKNFEELLSGLSKKLIYNKYTPSVLPVKKEYSKICSPFGNRKHPILNVSKKHEGVDYDAPHGADVFASANGLVTKAGWLKGYGRIVIIKHADNTETRYGHLSKILIKKGDLVNGGEIIGKVGNTGLSTTSHLHYEIRIKNCPVNPTFYHK